MAALSRVLRSLGCVRALRQVSPPWGAVPRRHLPICTVDTNLSESQLTEDFSKEFSQHIAELLNKPQQLVTVVVRSDMVMCRGGNTKPTVSVQIWSVGVFDQDRNPLYTKAIFKFLLSKLDVPEDRVTILFHPIQKYDAAHLLYADMKK